MKGNFRENLFEDMKATSLYYQMKNHVGFCYDENAIGNKLDLSYNRFWNLDDKAFEDQSSAVKENWVVISPSRDK